jgi:hypothetical protein
VNQAGRERVLARVAVGVVLSLLLAGAVACVDDIHHGWALANRRDRPLEVWLRTTELCADGANLSDERSYAPAQRLTIKAQEYVPLRGLGPQSQPGCGAVWLRVDGEFEVVLAWDDEPTWPSDNNPIPFSVIVEGQRDHLLLHIPDEIEELPPPGI